MGCQRGEKHSLKIQETRTNLKALAIEWEKSGEITATEREEILLLADDKDPMYWKPLVYVIPRVLVNTRLQRVELGKRASLGLEYIIPDLRRDEFDIIEID